MARPDLPDAMAAERFADALQWRAEQWLGQTMPARRVPEGQLLCFNGGPSNGSARPSLVVRCGYDREASMEGRAMARPDAVRRPLGDGWAMLQWRAEQWLGQTRVDLPGRHRRPHRFNGGPSNGSARQRLRAVLD